MGKCWVFGCQHCSNTDKCKFYHFPKDPKLKKKWITLLKRTDKYGSGTTLQVCSCHFEDGKKENLPKLNLFTVTKQTKNRDQLAGSELEIIDLTTNTETQSLEDQQSSQVGRMQYCCVPQCPNYKSNNANVVLHRFPIRDASLCNRWVTLLKVPAATGASLFVCDEHFTAEDFYTLPKDPQKKRLKRGKVPSRNLPKKPLLPKKHKLKDPNQEQPISSTVPASKIRKTQEKTTVLQALGLAKNDNVEKQLEPVQTKHVPVPILNISQILDNGEQSKVQKRPLKTYSKEHSIQYQKSRFGKLLNDASSFFADISKDIEKSDTFIEQRLSENSHFSNGAKDTKNVIVFAKEFKQSQTISTAECSERLNRLVDNLYDIVLPEESMACSEENHKGTQTRVVTLDKLSQTDFEDREMLLLKENQELKRRVSSLMVTVNTFEKLRNQPQSKFVYLVKQ